jgi:D-alanyl-lipoteichoic acid acyltransferase DltB (MBOAT superfamily)
LILDFSAETIPYMSIITSILFSISLIIFGWSSIKSRSIKNFQFLISLFIGLYIIGELFEIKEISTLLSLPDGLGSQIHAGATIFLTIVIWTRLYNSQRSIKSLENTPPDSI